MSLFDFSKDYSTNNVLPEGWYEVVIEKAEYKASKIDGTEYLNVMFKTATNQKIFSMYNVFNKSDVARSIAMGNLKEILISQSTDPLKLTKVSKEDLITLLVNGGPLMIAVSIQENNFGKQNVVKKYKSVEKKEEKKVKEIPF